MSKEAVSYWRVKTHEGPAPDFVGTLTEIKEWLMTSHAPISLIEHHIPKGAKMKRIYFPHALSSISAGQLLAGRSTRPLILHDNHGAVDLHTPTTLSACLRAELDAQAEFAAEFAGSSGRTLGLLIVQWRPMKRRTKTGGIRYHQPRIMALIPSRSSGEPPQAIAWGKRAERLAWADQRRAEKKL